MKTLQQHCDELNAITARLQAGNDAYAAIKSFENSFNGFRAYCKDQGIFLVHLLRMQQHTPEAVTVLLQSFVETLITK